MLLKWLKKLDILRLYLTVLVKLAHLIDTQQFIPLGLEMNANHIRSTRQGHVRAFASLIHQGKTTQVWNIDIKDDRDQLISVMRGTIAIKPIQ